MQQERSDSGESCSVEEGDDVFIVALGNEKKHFMRDFIDGCVYLSLVFR